MQLKFLSLHAHAFVPCLKEGGISRCSQLTPFSFAKDSIQRDPHPVQAKLLRAHLAPSYQRIRECSSLFPRPQNSQGSISFQRRELSEPGGEMILFMRSFSWGSVNTRAWAGQCRAGSLCWLRRSRQTPLLGSLGGSSQSRMMPPRLCWAGRGAGARSAPWSRDDCLYSIPLLEGESQSLLCSTGGEPEPVSMTVRIRGLTVPVPSQNNNKKGTTAAIAR